MQLNIKNTAFFVIVFLTILEPKKKQRQFSSGNFKFYKRATHLRCFKQINERRKRVMNASKRKKNTELLRITIWHHQIFRYRIFDNFGDEKKTAAI